MLVFFVVGWVLGMAALGTSIFSLLMGWFSLSGLSLGLWSTLIIAVLIYGYIVFLYMWYVLLVKRAHDLNISARITTIYYLVVCLVPILLLVMRIFFPIWDILATIVSWLLSLVGLAASIACLFVKGTTGDNIYGSDPLSSTISIVPVVVDTPNVPKHIGIKFFFLLVLVIGLVYASVYVVKNMIEAQFGNMFASTTVSEYTSSIDTWTTVEGTLLIEEDPEENILLVQAKETPFFPDYTYSRNAIYYDGELLSGADAQTFVVFDSVFGNDYALDKNYLYYKENIIGNSDPKSPLITDGDYIYHAGIVYYDGVVMSGVDPQTFTIFNYYTSDKHHIYYWTTIVDADVASFVELRDWNEEYDAYDNNHKFYNWDMLLDEQSCFDLRSVVQKEFDVLNDPNYICSDTENCDAVPVGNTLIDIFYSEKEKDCYLWEKYSVESTTYYEINPIQADGSWYTYTSDSIYSAQCVSEDLFLAAIDPDTLTGDALEANKQESICDYVGPKIEKELQIELQKL